MKTLPRQRGGIEMGRVSQETIDKLSAFIASLPEEARSKCALCNDTLVHIVKQAEVQTGAGTATVCRALADRVNDGAAMGDVVGDKQLRQRVLRVEQDSICTNRTNNQPVTNPDNQQIDFRIDRETGEVFENGRRSAVKYSGEAEYFVNLAMSQLERIPSDDPTAQPELERLIRWCEEKMKTIKAKP
jgi:hypothetical protein